MGYTHYFQQLKDCPTAAWDKLCNALPALALKVADRAPICREYDTPSEPPAIDTDAIAFNGVGPKGHETFVLTRKREVDARRAAVGIEGCGFCKTACKPYDVVAVAMLCLANHYARGVWKISSDGTPAEWGDGLALARTVEPKANLPAGVSRSD
jgi:hypothetical protein